MISTADVDRKCAELTEFLKRARPDREARQRIALLRDELLRDSLTFRAARDESIRLAKQNERAIPASPHNEKLWRGIAREHLLRARQEQRYALRARRAALSSESK